jgi:hypothetical protein
LKGAGFSAVGLTLFEGAPVEIQWLEIDAGGRKCHLRNTPQGELSCVNPNRISQDSIPPKCGYVGITRVGVELYNRQGTISNG